MTTTRARKGSLDVTLHFDKETPGTVRYKNADDHAGDLRIIYIQKEKFGGGKFPKTISVKAEW